MEKVVYGQNKQAALFNFRRLTPDKFVATDAKFAGTKHGTKVYVVTYRLRKGEY